MASNSRVLTTLTLALTFLLVVFANVRHTESDPRASLLVTEAILTHGTIKLDHYGEDFLNGYGYTIYKKNEHLYYFFPLGTSLASLPFVAIAKGLGLEMARSEAEVQIIIAAATAFLSVLLLLWIARFFLPPLNALLAASVFWLGTSLSSTSGTALWSHNFAVLFALLAVYGAISAAKCNRPQAWPLIGFALFAAYLCRPTLALLSPLLLLFLFSYHRAAAIKAGLLALLLVGSLSGFSMIEFGQVLPDYYLPKRLSGEDFQEAFYGNLLSPARGLLVYSPFILLVWGCLGLARKEWGLKSTWLLIGIAWPALHLVFVSRFPHWWGGGSYGPRFMMDALPGIFLLTLYAWPTRVENLKAKLAVGLFAAACTFSILVNTGQGLFNRYTAAWNAEPPIDRYPEYLFDWSYPQFMANSHWHELRLARHRSRVEILHDSDSVHFAGWSMPEETHRWTSGKSSSIAFPIGKGANALHGELHIDFASLGTQRATIQLNGSQIFSGAFDSFDGRLLLKFSPSLLKEGENTLEFALPDARQPGNGDARILGIALRSMRIQ